MMMCTQSGFKPSSIPNHLWKLCSTNFTKFCNKVERKNLLANYDGRRKQPKKLTSILVLDERVSKVNFSSFALCDDAEKRIASKQQILSSSSSLHNQQLLWNGMNYFTKPRNRLLFPPTNGPNGSRQLRVSHVSNPHHKCFHSSSPITMMKHPISYRLICSGGGSLFHKDRIMTQYIQHFSSKTTGNDRNVTTDFKDKHRRNRFQIIDQISALNPVGISQRFNFCTSSGTSNGKNRDDKHKKRDANDDKHNGALQQPAGPLFGNGITYEDDESLLEGDGTTLVKPTSSRYFIPQVHVTILESLSVRNMFARTNKYKINISYF